MTTLGGDYAGCRPALTVLFRKFGLQEVGQHDDLNYAPMTVRNPHFYVRIRSDFSPLNSETVSPKAASAICQLA
jgi:hypothetical protein